MPVNIHKVQIFSLKTKFKAQTRSFFKRFWDIIIIKVIQCMK